MKNLQKRILGSKQWVYCPLTGERCAYEADSAGTQLIDCAHYNPDTQECIHVEAARAQVRAADMLERAARAIEYLAECTTDPCIQPRRVLGITRERGATMSNLPAGVTDNMIPGNTPEDQEWEEMLNALNDSANTLYGEACEQLSESRYHRVFDDATVDRLLRDALGMTR